MSGTDIIKLITESEDPVQIHFVAGQLTYMKIQANVGEMSEAQLARFIQQIEERGYHGVLKAEKKEEKILVTWERSLKK